MSKFFSGISLAVALVLGLSPAALAHTQLEKSNPTDGASVNAPLSRIELTFSEPPLIDGSKISLSDSSGAIIPTGDTGLEGSTLYVPWPDSITPGLITINWRAVADDGHVEDGTLSFTYSAGATDSVSAVATPLAIATPIAIAEPLAAKPATSSSKIIPISLGVLVLIGGAWAVTRKKSGN